MADPEPTDLWGIYKKKFEGVKLQESIENPIDRMQTAAKEQITILTTLLTGGYFALTSFGDIDTVKNVFESLPLGNLLIILPMVCWLISLALANILYLSTLHKLIATIFNSKSRDYTEIMRNYLFYSHWFMFLGLIFLFVILLLYIVIPVPTPTQTPLQIQMIPLNS